MHRRVAAAALAAGVGAALLSACGSSHHAAAADPGIAISVSVDRCGAGWTDPKPGQEHFVLTDVDSRPGEVLLTDAKTGAVYADVEPVSPGASTVLDVDLGSGSYAFRCAMQDESTITGPTTTIPGTVKGGTPAVLSVTQADLIPATKAYQSYVTTKIPTLVALTKTLQGAVDSGDLAAARTDWLPAHLEYERLGAAYGAFGDLDSDINGLPNGLPEGVRDSGWTGFHRLEYGLWNGQSAATLKPVADKLSTDVAQLPSVFADAQVDPLEVSIRAHEITENAVQFELTGETDFGSHSNLATVAANLDGTASVLQILDPLLKTRDADLPQLTADLARVTADVHALAKGGAYPALTALTTSQRELVDSDMSELSEELAPVAAILEPRRAS